MNDVSELTFPYPARVLRVDMATRAAALMALAQARAFDPAIFESRQPFFWPAEISNNRLDSHYSRMMDNTLENFAADAKAGVSFINSHRHMELPFGGSLDGKTEQQDGRKRVLVDFYTLPGLTLNGVRTDDFIDGVRSGVVRDVSVGFHGGKHWCDICRQNYFSWDCPHIAGMTYEVKDVGSVMATTSIDGARLSEVSAVYDGSTPDATITKAQRMAESGELKPEAVRVLEARYRMRLPTKRSFAGADVPGKDKTMDFEAIVTQVREALSVPADGDVVATITGITGELAQLRTAKETADQRIKTLEVEAADGRQYRTDLVSETLAEGVRAFGEKFDKDTYGEMLKSAPLTVIKRMKTDWQSIGDERFSGGRKSQDNGDAPEKKQDKQRTSARIPAAAHKV